MAALLSSLTQVESVSIVTGETILSNRQHGSDSVGQAVTDAIGSLTHVTDLGLSQGAECYAGPAIQTASLSRWVIFSSSQVTV